MHRILGSNTVHIVDQHEISDFQRGRVVDTMKLEDHWKNKKIDLLTVDREKVQSPLKNQPKRPNSLSQELVHQDHV